MNDATINHDSIVDQELSAELLSHALLSDGTGEVVSALQRLAKSESYVTWPGTDVLPSSISRLYGLSLRAWVICFDDPLVSIPGVGKVSRDLIRAYVAALPV